MLIYNKYCGACRMFSPNYIKISELFHNELFFYALGKSSGYSKLFKINGYPTILFYSNNTYNEINIGRSVSKLSKYIREHIQYNCTEITYNNIDLVYNDIYQKDDRNLIIGYFEKNSKYINSFISTTNNLINDYNIDLCFYCTNYNLMINDKDEKYKQLSIFQDIKENEVKSYSKNKGDNSFIFNEDNNEGNYYENFLFNHVINLYEDIKDQEYLRLLKKMKNKKFVIFFYDNDEIKKSNIEIIYKLYNMTINKKDNLFYYILINGKIDLPKFRLFQKDKIYLTSNDLKDVMIINDLNILKNKILEKNLQSNNDLVTNITNEVEENKNIIQNKDNSNIIKKDDNKKENNIIDKEKNENNNYNLQDLADRPEEKDNGKKINKNNNSKNNKDHLNNIKQIIKQKTVVFLKTTSINNNKLKENLNINEKDIKENNNKKILLSKESYYKILALFLFILIIIMFCFIIKKYLCVGFIKVNSQIVEFNQPNKIEIV